MYSMKGVAAIIFNRFFCDFVFNTRKAKKMLCIIKLSSSYLLCNAYSCLSMFTLMSNYVQQDLMEYFLWMIQLP